MNNASFRDYDLLVDVDVEQIFAMTDDVAERAHKNAAGR
jgi:hypothetical protein